MPSASKGPRIPLVVLAAESGPSRDRGIRDLYLREIRFQCRLSLGALERALRLAGGSETADDAVWFDLQGVLTSAAIVSRLLSGADVRGNAEAKAYGKRRGARLRALLEVEDDSPVMERRLRNHVEHLDQRLDDLARDDRVNVIVDRFLTLGARPLVLRDGVPTELPMMRELAPHDGFAVFSGDSYDLFALRSELRRIQHRVDELLDEPAPPSAFATKVELRFSAWHRVDDKGERIQGDPYAAE